MNRRDTVLALLALGTASHTSVAEQQSKVWRIGFLGIRSRSTQSSPDVYYDAFVQGLRELGYIEGKNIVIEWRFADGKYQRLPSLAAELVKMNLDLIATHATPGTGALHRATNSIPIVFAAVGDPVARGFAATLAKPGGNMTGTSNIEFDLIEKQVEVMKTIVPRMLRLSILSNPGTAGHPPILRKAHAAALQYGVKILSFEASTLDEVGAHLPQ
jgi:putative ABC transport system substrate-binding protein